MRLPRLPVPSGTPWTHAELAAVRKLWQLERRRGATATDIATLSAVLLPRRSPQEVRELLDSREFLAHRRLLYARASVQRRGSAPPRGGPATRKEEEAADVKRLASAPTLPAPSPSPSPAAAPDVDWVMDKLKAARSNLDLVLGRSSTASLASDHAAALAAYTEIGKKKGALDALVLATPAAIHLGRVGQ